MANDTLLKGGIALLHSDSDNVTSAKVDILVRDGKITRVAPDISPDDSVHVLDCTNKIISPGFIDTHHHLWQTQLKGQHANHTLLEYFAPGNFASLFYTSEDAFWGQLAGALEALDAGTTMLVDHASVNHSPDHSYAALSASVASGIRSIFGYCPLLRAKSFSPFQLNPNTLEPWVMETFDKLAASAPYGNGRVSLGFAFDGLSLPRDLLQPLFRKVANAGIQLFTTHDQAGPAFKNLPKLHVLKGADLLDLLHPQMKTLISHANCLYPNDAKDLERYNVSISTTPTTELQMGMVREDEGVPVALCDSALAPYCSIGVDCHSLVSAFIPGQLRELVSATRIQRHRQDYEQGKWHRELKSDRVGQGFPSVEQAFNAATVGGARAVGLADQIGRIKEGYAADLVVWDTMSPGMLAGATQDPVATIVYSSSVRDVYGVLVAGQVRKWEGRLHDVNLSNDTQMLATEGYRLPQTGAFSWPTIAKKTMESQKQIFERMNGVDMKAAENAILDLFHMNKESMLE